MTDGRVREREEGPLPGTLRCTGAPPHCVSSLQEGCGFVVPQPFPTWNLETCRGALRWTWAGRVAKSLSFLTRAEGEGFAPQ